MWVWIRGQINTNDVMFIECLLQLIYQEKKVDNIFFVADESDTITGLEVMLPSQMRKSYWMIVEDSLRLTNCVTVWLEFTILRGD